MSAHIGDNAMWKNTKESCLKSNVNQNTNKNGSDDGKGNISTWITRFAGQFDALAKT